MRTLHQRKVIGLADVFIAIAPLVLVRNIFQPRTGFAPVNCAQTACPALASNCIPFATCVVVCVVTLRSLSGSLYLFWWSCRTPAWQKMRENTCLHCCSVLLPIARSRSLTVGSLNSQRGGQRFDPAQLHQHRHGRVFCVIRDSHSIKSYSCSRSCRGDGVHPNRCVLLGYR